MSTALTPQNVAEALTAGDNEYDETANGWLGISATGNVVNIKVTPADEDGDRLPKVRFEAHVFQVEPTPPVAADPVSLDPAVARELAGEPVGKGFDGWTVVEHEDAGTGRWESHHWLVIRNEAGEHYGAIYSKGLTEHQDTRPWESDSTARFDPVARHTTVIQAHSWLTRPELIKLHEYDELIFGGFICTHCTPDDSDSLDDPIAWPCSSLRAVGMTDEEAIALILARRAAVEEKARRNAEAAKASAPERSCACSEHGPCPAHGGVTGDMRLVDGPNGGA